MDSEAKVHVHILYDWNMAKVGTCFLFLSPFFELKTGVSEKISLSSFPKLKTKNLPNKAATQSF
jgi:hypothetical protein